MIGDFPLMIGDMALVIGDMPLIIVDATFMINDTPLMIGGMSLYFSQIGKNFSFPHIVSKSVFYFGQYRRQHRLWLELS